MRHPATLFAMVLLAACEPVSTPDTGSPQQTGTAASPVIDVVELSATEALRQMAAGRLTSRTLTQAYLDRIAAIDKSGPRLNSVIELNPQALDDAARLDAERASGNLRGPLHGLPVLLKDNIDAEGMVNSAGSIALAGNRPLADAYLVKQLRAAGALILGKTNLSEWANFRSTRSTSGWSSRGGQTRNAYVLDRNPCGSSSGTGTAITASLAAIGIGTETDGSIICPAAVSGLAALKPTPGLISRRGIIPISVSQDTAGPMARTITDLALAMNALAAADPADPAGAAAAGHIARDYLARLDATALQGRRFGLARQAMGYHPDLDAAIQKAAAAIRDAGATVLDVEIPTWGRWDEAEFTVLLYEFKDGLNRYLEQAGTGPRSLEELIAWNQANAATVMPFFAQEIFEKAQAKGSLADPAYLRARDAARHMAGTEGLLAVLRRHDLDALIAPATTPAWPTDHVLGDHFVGGGYGIAAVAGTPSLSVPIGTSHGLPVGMVFMGPAWSEAELLGYGFALEQALNARITPKFLPTLPEK